MRENRTYGSVRGSDSPSQVENNLKGVSSCLLDRYFMRIVKAFILVISCFAVFQSAYSESVAWIEYSDRDYSLCIYDTEDMSCRSVSIADDSYLVYNYTSNDEVVYYAAHGIDAELVYSYNVKNGSITMVCSIDFTGVVYAIYDDCCILIDPIEGDVIDLLGEDESVCFDCKLLRYYFDNSIEEYQGTYEYSSVDNSFFADVNKDLYYIENGDVYEFRSGDKSNVPHRVLADVDGLYFDYISCLIGEESMLCSNEIDLPEWMYENGLENGNLFLDTGKIPVLEVFPDFEYQDAAVLCYNEMMDRFLKNNGSKRFQNTNAVARFRLDDEFLKSDVLFCTDYAYEIDSNIDVSQSEAFMAYAVTPYLGAYFDEDDLDEIYYPYTALILHDTRSNALTKVFPLVDEKEQMLPNYSTKILFVK